MSKKRIISSILIAIIFILISLYNAYYINPKQLKVREEIIKTNKINNSLDGMTVAYFSDLNYGPLLNQENLDKLANKIELFAPDILIFGGDLLADSSIIQEDEIDLISYLDELESKHGKYAILGEKDNDAARSILTKGGFTILDNKSQTVYINKIPAINLVGLNTNEVDLINVYTNSRVDLFTLALLHKPDAFDKLAFDKTDYALAGHSLGGQVYIPVINIFYRPSGAMNYYHGKYSKNDTTLDISNGVGYQNKKVRFLADSEFVIYRFTYQP